jgi:hypothetical protein
VRQIPDAGKRAALLVSVACQIPAALLNDLRSAAGRLATADQRFRLLLSVACRRPRREWTRDWPVAELAGLGRSQVGAVLIAAAMPPRPTSSSVPGMTARPGGRERADCDESARVPDGRVPPDARCCPPQRDCCGPA